MRRTGATFAAFAVLIVLPATARADLPGGNLLTNPGAEVGPTPSLVDFPYPAIPGWTDTADPSRMRALDEAADSDANADFITKGDRATVAGLGCRMFAGPGNPGSGEGGANTGEAEDRVFQDVPLAGIGAGQTLRFGAVLGRYSEALHPNDDWSSVVLRFYDQGDNLIANSTYVLSNAADTAPTTPPFALKSVDSVATYGAIAPPAGAVTATIFVISHAVGVDQAGHPEAEGTVDNAYLTADGTVPPPPSAGCQAPAVTTGDVSGVGQTTAHLTGTLDPHGEQTTWSLRISTDPNGSGGEVAGENDRRTAGTVAGDASSLNPGTTYYYWLEATSYQGGPNTPYGTSKGQVRSFTTAAAPSTPTATTTTTFTPPPPPDPNPGALTVKLTADKQRLDKILVSGFEFTFIASHQGQIKANVYVKSGRKRYAVGGLCSDDLIQPGSRNYSREPTTLGKAAGTLRKAIRKHRSATLVVVWSFVDGLGKRITGTTTFVEKGGHI